MLKQQILTARGNYEELDNYLKINEVKRIFLVCDGSLPFLKIGRYFDSLTQRTGIEVIKFSDITPNPLYESVVDGVRLFCEFGADLILAVGGGSAMDVAKCIKLFFPMDPAQNYLEQTIVPNSMKLLAVPTTAGTGSEATRYAVIYFDGEKQSISDYSCSPSAVLMDASVLKTLPIYQKKSTMMDAFCHAIESYWSVNSSEESRQYSRRAIQLIMENKDLYIGNDETGNTQMLKAAHLAGKAINLTQTTAGHAMCYKLTSLYGIAHGHAAALCVSRLWPFMLTHLEYCIDPRGNDYLAGIFEEIANAMGYSDTNTSVRAFQDILKALELEAPDSKDRNDYEVLKSSVNPVRLKNNPIELSEDDLDRLYHQIFSDTQCRFRI